jgi:hypothetical protein
VRISFGDVVWALVGIGVVLIIVISVLLYTGDEGHTEVPVGDETAVVLVI